ncbi:hypothetical protein [Chitinophaga eiseniae]|uniref:Lipoprotein n=1 Tax=Chitinophaga eiseniae TaxID=634771 RepID=A0A847SCK7_9BACT|nr:hypothetical protein [Chitinophaga eiseniae]NLR79521.1 hypothetical protein [Chitinophaga eiseniae]
MKYLLLTIVVFFSACASPKMDAIQSVYNSRDTIISLFRSKSIMRSRGENNILFCTHKDGKTNKYYFEVNENHYEFISDSITYSPDILDLKDVDSIKDRQQLISHTKWLLDMMDKLSIRDIQGDLSDVGIDLKIYMKQGAGIILYVPDSQKIGLEYWKNYIGSMKKIDAHWYYSTTMN